MTRKIFRRPALIIALAVAAPAPAAEPRGQDQAFKSCLACHAGAGQLGPDLHGVIGRKAGSREDYRYSNAMRRAGFVWDETTLRAFLKDPQSTVKGTKMPFAGIGDDEISRVISYLRGLK